MMKFSNVRLLSFHFLRNATQPKTFYLVYVLFLLLTAYSAVSSIQNHKAQNEIRSEHQAKARESWEANPDKHPHRMSHFGTFAFRLITPLAMFDNGLESYTGNTVFLEAHRQNSMNFSDASFSTGTLRFGELNMALLLQLILPLILIFIGFSSVAKDRQNGTLKIIIAQGASWLDILTGKSIGLFSIAILFFFPVFVATVIALVFFNTVQFESFPFLRFSLITIGYLLFLFVVSTSIIVLSARSKTPKNALILSLGIWLLLVILLPKSAQALGNYWSPTPTKLAFEAAIEKEVIKKGDSHNPNDPYYNTLRDSVLRVNHVEKVTDLPFNYSGFVMREGEKISSTLYKKHYASLLENFERQNGTSKILALLNPFMAVEQFSMSISGTDFHSYLDFQKQADDYRYHLAQTMNELQMEYISPKKESGSEGKTHVVGQEHWEEFSEFQQNPLPIQKSISSASSALIALLVWPLLMMFFLIRTSKTASAL